MKLQRRTLLSAALGTSLMLAAHLPAYSAEQATIRIAYNLPKNHATGFYFETLAKEIEARTAKTSLQLKARTFPNGQLFNDTQLPDAVSTGAAEIGQMNIGFMNGPGTEPLRVWGLPFLYNSWEALWATEDNPTFKGVFNTQFEKFGMHMLSWVQYGLVEFYASKPIKLPADMKGLRMRAFGVDTSMLIRDLGGSPVSLSSQEMFQAVQRGTIDGFITGPTSVYSRKLYEVTKYGTNLGINYLSFMATANLDWWKKLPADTRAAVVEAADVAQKAARERAKVDDQDAKDKLTAKGVVAYNPTPADFQQWVDASKDLYENYKKQAGPQGEELLAIISAANKQFAPK